MFTEIPRIKPVLSAADAAKGSTQPTPSVKETPKNNIGTKPTLS